MSKAIQIGLVALAALAVAFGIRRLRYTIWRLQRQAPVSAQIAFGALLVLALALVFTKLISIEVFAVLIIPAALVLALWGWARYQKSPILQRRAKADREITLHLASNNIGAAEAIILAQMRADDAEREQLRAAAPRDRSAAVEFQRKTQAELANWNRTAILFKRTVGSGTEAPAAGEKIFVTHQVRLEADLEWIRTVLSNSVGAA